MAGFRGAHCEPVDTISFGSDRDPGRWWPGRWRGRRAWPVVLAAAVVAVAAVVLVTTRGHARRAVSVPVPSGQPLPPPLLAGVPVRAARTGLLLGGDYFWRVGRQPRTVLAGFLSDGLSPLLPPRHSAQVDQLATVAGGVVALVSDVWNGIRYGALGRVVLIRPNAPARVIARATAIAVGPSGRRVWVQTGTQSADGAPARSPTWAVNLSGRRASLVLRLPLGLAGAMQAGPLTQTVRGQLLQWDGTTGRPMHLYLPAGATFITLGRDRAIWQSCDTSCRLHVTNLRTGQDVAVPLPWHWALGTPSASFGLTGRRFALALDRVDSSGNAIATDMFVADTVTRTLRMVPGTRLVLPSSATMPRPQLLGSWDAKGMLWVLATNPGYDYYQLGFWAGEGPLQTFAPAQGRPTALAAPGPGSR